MIYEHPECRALIELALCEDLRFTGDLTVRALVPPGARLHASITAKQAGVVCGLPVAGPVFDACGGGVALHGMAEDGAAVAAGETVLRMEGPADVLLMGERTLLNIAQRLSGTATLARRLSALCAGTRARLFDTRKTTPGMRILQKHAVAAGGAATTLSVVSQASEAVAAV